MTRAPESGPGPPARDAGSPRAPPHRWDIDWLRVLGMLSVLVIHAAEPFNPWDEWHIRNPDRSRVLGEVVVFFAPWIMPLFMFLAGGSARYALQTASNGEFLRERARRLLVPLIFGVLVLVPPQVYWERRLEGTFHGTYLQFYPHFFEGIYPAGNFSWHHLWFLLHLFVYAVVTLPLFRLLEGERGAAWLGRARRLFRRPIGFLAFSVPLLLWRALAWAVAPRSSWVTWDWPNHLLLLLFYVYGYVLTEGPDSAAPPARRGRVAMGLAVLLSAGVFAFAWPSDLLERLPRRFSLGYWTLWAAYTLAAWVWVIALADGARRFMSFRSSLIERARPLVYPFYLLQQTVIVAFAFHIVRWAHGPIAKFVVLTALSFAVTVLLCGLIERWSVTRALFGLTSASTRPVAANEAPAHGGGVVRGSHPPDAGTRPA